jgi:hypothetical protein
MRILNWPLDKILEEVEILESQCKQLKFDLSKLCWFMRGSVSLTEAYEMCIEDREIMFKLIKENLETAKATKQPFW